MLNLCEIKHFGPRLFETAELAMSFPGLIGSAITKFLQACSRDMVAMNTYHRLPSVPDGSCQSGFVNADFAMPTKPSTIFQTNVMDSATDV